MRRRIYLMRHGAVTYFAEDGTPARPDDLSLNEDGLAQAEAARALLEPVELDRVLASPLPRTVETAEIVARSRKANVEIWPELRELQGDRLSSIPVDELEEEFVHAFRGVVPNQKRFLGGETIGELFDRTLPAIDRLLSDESWDAILAVLHSAVNQAIMSYALTGERLFLGHFEQAPGCVNILDVGDDWPATAIVRAVNLAPLDLLHSSTRLTTMEGYWEQYRPGTFPSGERRRREAS
jgi:probable phosphoglycerate mutase